MRQNFIKEEKRRHLVFYFTATGNNLYVARQFSDKPLSRGKEQECKIPPSCHLD